MQHDRDLSFPLLVVRPLAASGRPQRRGDKVSFTELAGQEDLVRSNVSDPNLKLWLLPAEAVGSVPRDVADLLRVWVVLGVRTRPLSLPVVDAPRGK